MFKGHFFDGLKALFSSQENGSSESYISKPTETLLTIIGVHGLFSETLPDGLRELTGQGQATFAKNESEQRQGIEERTKRERKMFYLRKINRSLICS